LQLPKSVRQKSIFIVDLKIFRLGDLKADDNGSWDNNGVKTKFYKISNANSSKREIQPCASISQWPLEADGDTYRISRYSFQSRSNSGFIRKIVRMESSDGQFDKCLLIYYWKDGRDGFEDSHEPYSMPAHGNAQKSNISYIRSEKSTLDQVNIFNISNFIFTNIQ
jgi:hypothetical protein